MFLFQPLPVHIPDVKNQPRKNDRVVSLSLFGSFSIPELKSWWEKKLPCCIYNLSTWKYCGSNHKI